MGSLNRGGAETLVLDVCNNIRPEAFKITLIHRKKGKLLEDFYKSKAEVKEVFPKHSFDFLYLLNIRRIIKKQDILVIHTHQVIDALIAYVTTFFLPTKIILSLHGHGVDDTFLLRLMRRFVMNKVDLNLFVSNSQLNYYVSQKYKLGSSKVLHNGVDFNKFNATITEQNNLRKTFGVDPEEILLGSVGNFSSGRDQLTICKFLKLLKEKEVKFKFVFVGENVGVFYDRCYEYCKANNLLKEVLFLGSRSDVPAILRQLDVFIYSTIHDTFGIAVVEAMGQGVPVLANDWGAMMEITNNGMWATVYKSKDEKDLMVKFMKLYLNREVYKLHAEEMVQKIQNTYGISNYIKQLSMVYKNI